MKSIHVILQTGKNGDRLSLPHKNTLGFNDLAGKIVIIGAAPSPVSYGLTPYGVAADHQGTKNVTRQFSRIFER